MSAIKINSYREEVVDFSEAFMETGIAIMVAKRTGIVSPKAFLEPFDNISWLFILVIGIQVAALSIFLFEWLSPSGYGMKLQAPRAVNVDCPRGYTARYMASVWAMFAVVFIAIYTANLAAFMITREEYYKLSGVEDPKLANPLAVEPPFRYGTVPYSNTHVIIQRNLPQIHEYMKPYNQENVNEGMEAVKNGTLDAFIYDATVLQHLVGQDDDCKLLTVGSWYSRTGYGIAFMKNSKYLKLFNRQMLVYKDNGDLERLQRFWLSGGCRPAKKNRSSSNPLSLDQFTSAFLLLSCGILLAVSLMILEHIYFKYVRKHLAKTDSGGCCSLISLSMARSLTFRGAVSVAQDLLKIHKCNDPVCDMYLWKIRQELDVARLRISILECELQNKDPQTSRRFSHVTLSPKKASETQYLTRDMTRNHLETNEPVEVSEYHKQQHYYKSVSKEIAEHETVL
uniref:Ionotropic glutamate receptor C-terminal domain-containing protein n=1 Tax=Strigamia maritima TaxID=126957 RepID=T1IK45_STRMM